MLLLASADGPIRWVYTCEFELGPRTGTPLWRYDFPATIPERTSRQMNTCPNAAFDDLVLDRGEVKLLPRVVWQGAH